MRTFIINLERAKDRRAHMLGQLSSIRLDYEFVAAVDGATLDTTNAALIAQDWARQPRNVVGSIGAQLSHVRAYEAILEARVPSALVLEDDTLLSPDLPSLLDEAASHLNLAEVLLLHLYTGTTQGSSTVNGAAIDPPCRLSREGTISLSGDRLIAYPMDLTHVTSASAYIITADACRNMIQRLLPIHADSDAWSYFHSQGILQRVRCVAPLPVKTNPRFGSTVHHGAYSWRDQIYNAIEHVPFPLATTLLTLRRQRHYRRGSAIELVSAASPYSLQQCP